MIFGIHIDRLQYKTAYHYETVRPWKIYDASKYLVENSTLYKEEGIQLDTSWMNRDDYSEHEVNFIVDEVKNSYATEEHAEADDISPHCDINNNEDKSLAIIPEQCDEFRERF